MTVYFISGLGADKRIFQKLTFPQNWIIKHIEWVDHSKDESLADYCRKLTAQIDTSIPFSLVGLSFGGIVAVELSKIISPEKILILSSISTSKELPMDRIGNFLLRKLKIQQFIPPVLFKNVNAITYWIFGTKKTEEKFYF